MSAGAGEGSPGLRALARRGGTTGGVIFVLSLVGLGVSGYLWSVKVGASQLICGPLGDCATVNASPYSEFWGIPIAALGTGMYAFIAVCAGLQALRLTREWPGYTGFSAALAGAIFSLYLTALEAFVIHAYCIWCIVSLILVTAIAAVWGMTLWRARGDEHGRSDHPVHE